MECFKGSVYPVEGTTRRQGSTAGPLPEASSISSMPALLLLHDPKAKSRAYELKQQIEAAGAKAVLADRSVAVINLACIDEAHADAEEEFFSAGGPGPQPHHGRNGAGQQGGGHHHHHESDPGPLAGREGPQGGGLIFGFEGGAAAQGVGRGPPPVRTARPGHGFVRMQSGRDRAGGQVLLGQGPGQGQQGPGPGPGPGQGPWMAGPHALAPVPEQDAVVPLDSPAAPLAQDAGSPVASPQLQWTASRKALEVLVVREEQFSRTNQGLQRLSHDQRLQQRLDRLNLDVITMVGDGNCQFRTISQQLFDTQEHHPQVRQSVIKYMRSHREEFECFLGEDFSTYLTSMARTGTWGDELTLRAACDAFGVVMHVVTSDAQNWYLTYEPSQKKSEREVFLTYIAPIHYNAIKRRSSLRALSKQLSSSFNRIRLSGGIHFGPSSSPGLDEAGRGSAASS